MSNALLRVEPLDVQIRRVLLDRIMSREMLPGTNLNEAKVAAELGVSRTPLRQAFIRLEQDGFLVQEPNRGFFVAPLSSEEASEIYPILAVLESTALRSAPPTSQQLAELRTANRELAAVPDDDPSAAATLNFQWHEKLLERCTNGRLRQMLTTLRHQAFRYEVTFFSPGAARIATSLKLHRGILEALAKQDLELACERLEAHWVADLDAIVPAGREAPAAPQRPRPNRRRRS